MGISRRNMMAGAVAALLAGPKIEDLLAAGDRRFKIGACDWSIGRRQQLNALDLAKSIGLDGVQVSFDDVGAQYDLRKEEVRRQYAARAKELGIEISSLAMGILNGVPYATEASAEQWVVECIDVMEKMGQKIVLLAFFGKGDIKGSPQLQAAVIQRLKKVAPAAERAGVILGIESWLDVDEHLRLLEGIASPAVKVYYDVANMEKMGYDIYKEIRRLGKDRICQFHCKENASLLGEGRVDFRKIKEAVDEIGWSGWLIIEGATVQGRTLEECYAHNRKYLESVFRPA